MTATKNLLEKIKRNKFCENQKCQVTIWKPGEMVQPGRRFCAKCEHVEAMRKVAERRQNEERVSYLNSFLRPQAAVELIDDMFVVTSRFHDTKALLDAVFKIMPPEDIHRVKTRLLATQ